MPLKMLKVTDVSFSYGNVQTLYDVSMQMPSGCITAIMGRNGVGKTTLIKTIMGLCRHHHGQIALDDADLSPLTSNQRARGGLGLVPQGRQIFPKLTVEENLQVALQARSDGKRIVPGELYDVFPILGTMRKRRGGDLSGGQQQQLAIARALAGNPKVLLLDEPTEGIQPNIIQLIGQVLRDLARTRNMTIVLVEQYLDFVREISQHFYVMSRGRVVAGGETAGLSDALVEEHLQV